MNCEGKAFTVSLLNRHTASKTKLFFSGNHRERMANYKLQKKRPNITSSHRNTHHLFYRVTCVLHVLFAERRMHLEHQAGLAQLSRHCKTSLRTPFTRKRLLQINLAADSTEARNSLGVNCRQNPITVIASPQVLALHKNVVLVIRMTNLGRRRRHS